MSTRERLPQLSGDPFITDGGMETVLIFDYGAGTCDLSLVRARYNRESKNGLEVQNLAK